MEEDQFSEIHISRISTGTVHTLPIKPVRITPPGLILNNSDLNLYCQKNKTEKESIRKSCGFKRSLTLKKELEKTNRELYHTREEYMPVDLTSNQNIPAYTPSPIELDTSKPGTSGSYSRQDNYSLNNSSSVISFNGLDTTLTASSSSLNFINNIMNLDFEEQELNDATETLNNTLMND